MGPQRENIRLQLAWFALAAVVLLQAAGLVLSTLREGTSVGSWLFLVLRWPERSSIVFEQAAMAGVAAASFLAVLTRRAGTRLALAALVSGWFTALALGEWRMGGAPFTSLSLVAHAARIVPPLLLALWQRPGATRWILRGAIAATFGAHGYEALQLHPGFVDYLLAADLYLFNFGLEQSTAELLLRVIGAVDLLVAVLVLTGRDLRSVLIWAAAWGIVTALSRVVQGGEGALHQTLIRAANGGLPLVLLLLSNREKMNTSMSSFGRRAAYVALPVLLMILPAIACAQSLSGSEPGHLRLVWTEDPAHRATLSWSTNSAGSTHEVYFDTQPRGGDLSAYAHKVSASSNGAYSGTSANYHHAQLTGLAPSTTYHFVVVSDGRASPERHFISAPADDREFRLLFGGDSRTGLSDRKKMNQLMARLADEDPGIIALAHGGDYNDSSTSWSEWNGWLADHALTFTSSGRVLPIIPTRGNHEGDGVLFNQVFGKPGGSANYYVTQLGANTTFITLDSNVSHGGTQREWLEARLKEAQSSRWIIPSYHKPAFPAVKTPGSARQFWVPLFEQYNVDVVCESDGHVLKRTVPIRNEKQDPTGIVYVGEGGLGVPQRAPISAWYLNSPGMAKSAHHVQVFSVSPNELKYEARTMSGAVEDSYTFKPRRTGTPVQQPEPVTPEPVSLASIEARSETSVALTYGVDMDAASAGAPSAYGIAPDVSVTDVAQQDARTFVLTTTPLTPDAEYVLSIEGVSSAAGATPSEPITASFRAPSPSGEPLVTLPPDEPQPAPQEPSPKAPVGAEPGAVDPLEDDPYGQSVGCTATGGAALGWMSLAIAGGALGLRRRASRKRRSRPSA